MTHSDYIVTDRVSGYFGYEVRVYDDGTEEAWNVCGKCDEAVTCTRNGDCGDCQPKRQCVLCSGEFLSLHNCGACTPCFQECGVAEVQRRKAL